MISNHLSKIKENQNFIWVLTKREIKSQYKQSILGGLWIILQPLFLIMILTVVFSLFVRLPSEGLPYPLFLTAAIIPWRFFTGAAGGAPKIITGFAGIIKQRNFYRPALVFVKLVSEMISFLFASISILLLMLYYGVMPGVNSFYAILIFAVQLILTLGVMFILAATNVYVRDIGLLTPLVMRVWFYLSPIIYSYSFIPIQYQPYLALNPMTGIIDGYRRTLLHNQLPDFTLLTYSFVFGLVVLLIGWFTFLKLEKNFADVI
ncbi:ABC transporter permease [Bacillus taeanensis]|uniref:Transport permease protein n=1 Tax=Bacillus taeanensis TaxID=273032 RepID=A0A366XRZ8_9BACI|nr:ABC transporter permease [Bacillus taeanensis]RBW68902.1 ABC transporter permease [Bacillus taeanensis]